MLLLDRAQFPRYKTCGGGLIGPTLANLPAGFQVPSRADIHRATVTLAGGRWTDRHSDRRLIALVNRAEFDAALVDSAKEAGAHVQQGVTVTGIEQVSGPDGHSNTETVTLTTSEGPLTASYVIGADGSASRTARHVGVTADTIDLGLEVELETGAQSARWESRVHLDWGTDRGTYGWVFPKGDTLTVGVIQSRGHAAATRAYLARFIHELGLSSLRELRSSGHLTRTRAAGSPLSRGRVLVAGDAAGLLEPWTREGISFAVRSGKLAGSAVGGNLSDPLRVRTAYDHAVDVDLVPEMAAGRLALRAFERSPAIMHQVVARTRRGWGEFERLTSGETTLARELERRPIRWGLQAIAR